MKKISKVLFFSSLLFLLYCSAPPNVLKFESSWNEITQRQWLGPEYWANRLQDWRVNKGRLECINGNAPMRTVHLLTHELSDKIGDLNMSVKLGLISNHQDMGEKDWVGFLIGAGTSDMSYKSRSLIHNTFGAEGGVIAAIDGKGIIHFFDSENQLKAFPQSSASEEIHPELNTDGLELKLYMHPTDSTYIVELSVYDHDNKLLSTAKAEIKNQKRFGGNVALISNGGTDFKGESFWFKNWEVYGTKIAVHKDRIFGPVFGVQYTLNQKTLNMTAQMPPLSGNDSQILLFEVAVKGSNKWSKLSEQRINPTNFTVHFTVKDWDGSKDYEYRLKYYLIDSKGNVNDYYYKGIIPHEPTDKEEITVVSFNGNTNTSSYFGNTGFDFKQGIFFPHQDLTKNAIAQHPDIVVFTGNQINENSPTLPDTRNIATVKSDYLYKWILWFWAFGDVTRNQPTITVTDAHDYFQPNLWGEGGKKAPAKPFGSYPTYYKNFERYWSADRGGFIMPTEFVRFVEQTQISHLPNPSDTSALENGLKSYFTNLVYGGIDFAILEGKKFKNAPENVLPNVKSINGFPLEKDIDTKKLRVPSANLLGSKQSDFLKKWATSWKNATVKVAVIDDDFSELATYPDSLMTSYDYPNLPLVKDGTKVYHNTLSKNMGSNGFPIEARSRALNDLRKSFTSILCSGSHLGRVIHHGTEEWDDAGFSFAVPPVVNVNPAQWFPILSAKKRQDSSNEALLDGFGNKISLFAITNPSVTNKAAGYGVMKINKKSYRIKYDCFSRSENKSYKGFPVNFSVYDNFKIDSKYDLPRLRISGLATYPVLTVYEANGTLLYSIRLNSFSYQAKVNRNGVYKVVISVPETGKEQVFEKVKSNSQGELEVRF